MKIVIYLLFPILLASFLVGQLALKQVNAPELNGLNSTNTEPIIETPAELENPAGNEASEENVKPLSNEEYERLKTEKLNEILGGSYKIFIEGDCGEVLAVKRSETLKMDDTEAIYLKWSVAAMEKAVVLKKTDIGYEAVFTVDNLAMRNNKGEAIIEQIEAKYGYGFQRTEEGDYWTLDFAMLNQDGKIASELASFYWDREKCGYAFFMNNEPIEL